VFMVARQEGLRLKTQGLPHLLTPRAHKKAVVEAFGAMRAVAVTPDAIERFESE
jgi:hypothetical protein